jgi:hypothetical protein
MHMTDVLIQRFVTAMLVATAASLVGAAFVLYV